jgi:hypothetical protein
MKSYHYGYIAGIAIVCLACIVSCIREKKYNSENNAENVCLDKSHKTRKKRSVRIMLHGIFWVILALAYIFISGYIKYELLNY